MANIKSAIKRIKTSAKKKTRNGLVLAPAKSAYKKANKALANSDEKSLEMRARDVPRQKFPKRCRHAA